MFLKDSTDQLLVVGENTLSDPDLVTLTRTEDVILLNLTCEFSIKKIKKLAIVEEVLGHGWMDCDSRTSTLQRPSILVRRLRL